MTEQEWKQAIISYIILHGEYDSIQSALNDVVDWSGQDYFFCMDIVYTCYNNSTLKIKSKLQKWLWSQLHGSYKYNFTITDSSLKLFTEEIKKYYDK